MQSTLETAFSIFLKQNSLTSHRNPRPLIRIGEPGQTGNVELQDLLFTTKGATAGATLVEWNIKAASPGSAAMWG